MDVKMNQFTYQAEKFNQTKMLGNIYNVDFVSNYSHCSACEIKDYIKYITLYFATEHNEAYVILIRSFCSNNCLNQYLEWRTSNSFIHQIFNSNISNEDFIRELKKFEKLIIKSKLLE